MNQNMLKQYIRQELPVLVVFFVAMALLIVLPSQIPESKMAQASVLGPRFFPRVMLCGVMLFCLLGIAGDANQVFRNKQPLETEESATPKHYRNVLALIVALMAWYLLLKTVGFILMTAILMAVSMLLLGNRNKLQIVLIPTFFSVALYLLFANYLNVMLPKGLFYL